MWSILILSMSVIAQTSFGEDPTPPKLVKAPIKEVYLPAGFDNNDVAQVVIEGEFPNSCYKIGPAKVRVDPEEKTIGIAVAAYEYKGNCLQVINTYLKVIDVGILRKGSYRIVGLTEPEKNYGLLNIQQAPSADIDSFSYAAVDSVFLQSNDMGQRRVVTMVGFFRDSCTHFKEFDQYPMPIFRTSDHLVEMLPIIERNVPEDQICLQQLRPFFKHVTLPDDIPVGKYLFHVRTMNGNSINHIDYVKENQN